MTVILTLLFLATSGLTISSYLGFWPDRVSFRQSVSRHLNRQGSNWASQFILYTSAEVISYKPCLAWRVSA